MAFPSRRHSTTGANHNIYFRPLPDTSSVRPRSEIPVPTYVHVCKTNRVSGDTRHKTCSNCHRLQLDCVRHFNVRFRHMVNPRRSVAYIRYIALL